MDFSIPLFLPRDSKTLIGPIIDFAIYGLIVPNTRFVILLAFTNTSSTQLKLKMLLPMKHFQQ